MTTEGEVNIERKGVDVRRRPNVLHLILASNDLSVVRATGDERRYFVLDVSSSQRQEHSYFRAIQEQMRAGGHGALLKMLMELDLAGFNVRRAPRTTALQDQVDRNLEPMDEWVLTLLIEGTLPNNVRGIANRAWWGESGPDARDGLVDHARRTVPRLRDATETALGRFLTDWGVECPERGGKRSRAFPPLAELRAAWCEKHGQREWPGGDDAEWTCAPAPPYAEEPSGEVWG